MELPGWNSIQTTETLANVFFWVSIAALVLLLIAQVISYSYGEQRDLLVSRQHAAEKEANNQEIARLRREAAALTINVERSKAATAGANARTQEAQQALAGANARAQEVQEELEQIKAPRTLSDEATRAIKLALKPFAGQQWTMATFWDLKEPVNFATLLYEPLNGAGWKYDDSGSKSVLVDGLAGVQVSVHPQADVKVKAAAAALVAVLNKYHFNAAMKLVGSINNPDNIQINVGTKPDLFGLDASP
jgi:hypothetical protein